jgi:hypothetical protein
VLKRKEVAMTAASTIKHHDMHEVFSFLGKSSLSALKGSFFLLEGLVGFAILASVLVFVFVFLSFLLYAISF